MEYFNPIFTEKLFWQKVKKTKNCWRWVGSKDLDGYGLITTKKYKISMCRAHRISYFLKYGKFKNNLLVCHRCDNPSCVNPEHLFLSDAFGNTQDMLRKGRNFQQKKTRCPAGHKYSGYNLSVNSNGHRKCKACHRDRERIRRKNAKNFTRCSEFNTTKLVKRKKRGLLNENE